ncbi:lipopolysaccharide biosynthesis protein [Streptomyces sp. KLOTTS4A1]|uniref:lipopolysaccharide biosynthesis protein n=1 Tax=Streptomyces sp. KLOTTS4A1 TaxID=3390996 RepID=UPI0039F46E5C
MRLTAALRRLRQVPRWWPLPACAALGLLAGAGYGVLAPPQYASTAYLIVVSEKGFDPSAAVGFAQSYGRLATSASTLAQAQKDAGVPARELASHVQTETSPESPMVGVTGTATRPGKATEIANAVADSLSRNANRQRTNTGVRLVNYSKAVKPLEPVSPSLPLSAGVGLCGGGLVGGLALLVRPRQVRAGGASVPAQGEAAGVGEAVVGEPVQGAGGPAQAKEKVTEKEKEKQLS